MRVSRGNNAFLDHRCLGGDCALRFSISSHGRRLAVGEFLELVKLATKHNLVDTFQKILKLTRGWDEAVAHAQSAVQIDNALRVWWPHGNGQEGLVFKAKEGSVCLNEPAGQLLRACPLSPLHFCVSRACLRACVTPFPVCSSLPTSVRGWSCVDFWAHDPPLPRAPALNQTLAGCVACVLLDMFLGGFRCSAAESLVILFPVGVIVILGVWG